MAPPAYRRAFASLLDAGPPYTVGHRRTTMAARLSRPICSADKARGVVAYFGPSGLRHNACRTDIDARLRERCRAGVNYSAELVAACWHQF